MRSADLESLRAENEALRRESSSLRGTIDGLLLERSEARELIRAMRAGEIDALLIEERGREEVYAVQKYDSVYRGFIEECFPYGIWLAEPTGRLTYVSQSFLALVGSEFAELRARGLFHFLPAETRTEAERLWMKSLASGEPFSFEYALHATNGSIHTISVRALFATRSDGTTGWVGVHQDVTDRAAAAEELRRKARELELANQRKDEFLAMLGHELRNPLAAIRGAIAILFLENASATMLDFAKHALERQSANLTRLVDDLLDVSRITTGKIELRKQSVVLSDVMSAAIDLVRELVENQRHTLTVDLPSVPVVLEADPTRLEQVLSNVIHNAVKCTPPRGHISVTAELVDSFVIIRVRDTGIGIAPERLGEIFGLFTQVDEGLDRPHGGLGIGLTLSRKLVELHGGSITARSDGLERGSEFEIRLPAEPAAPIEPTDRCEAKPGVLRVLVVEDEAEMAESLRVLVSCWGHDVRVIHDGAAASVVYRTYRPDVVLLDIGLPGMNGYDLARVIKQMGDGRPFIVGITGYGTEEHRQRALEAGFDRFFVKPLDPEVLEVVLGERQNVTGN